MYPKLKFTIAPLKKELEMFNYFLKQNHMKQYVYNKYPELKYVQDITKIITHKKKEFAIKSKINAEFHKNWWIKFENKFMPILPEVLNTNWFKETISVQISIDPICPRFLKDKSFFIPYYYNIQKWVAPIFAHEITHFLYFKKFGELFPEIKKRKYDYPYIEWILSEILVSIILKDSKFNGFFKIEPGSYPVFYKSKIGTKTIMQVFEDKYKQMVEKDKKKFDDYLKWAYTYAKKHEKQLMVVN